jgi:all-trans-8'-apo-beta-carotenal 15,15'-oxygenase
MHPLLTLFSCLSSKAVSSSFWNDLSQVNSLSDPPSQKFLTNIQKRPWRGGLEPVPTEGIQPHQADIIEGKIPSDLQGMLCRNGPGRIRIGDNQYGHWFDGDGFVTRLCIDGTSQTATYSGNYVETERFQAQQKIEQKTGNVPLAQPGAWTKRGQGRWWENLFVIPTNPSNTNVIFFPNKQGEATPSMYALSEGGSPVQMDPMTLDTIGPKPFQSSTTGESITSFFSAHYAQDPETGDIYNHGIILAPKTAVNIMKLDSNGELIRQLSTEIPLLTFLHDNLISENHFILLVPPFEAPQEALLQGLLGGEPLGKRFAWNAKGGSETTAMFFSKETLECVARVPLPLLSTYHFVDAFEDPKNANIVTLRAAVHDPPDSRTLLEESFMDLYGSTKKLPLCQIMEYTVDIETCQMIRSRPVAPNAVPFELPDMNAAWGYRKRYAYTNTREDHVDFANSLQKVDMETGECSEVIAFGDGVYAGGPIFVPKENATTEDDGYIVTQLYRSNDHGSDISILDASSMKQLALLRLAKPVPYQFHGSWYPGSF